MALRRNTSRRKVRRNSRAKGGHRTLRRNISDAALRKALQRAAVEAASEKTSGCYDLAIDSDAQVDGTLDGVGVWGYINVDRSDLEQYLSSEEIEGLKRLR